MTFLRPASLPPWAERLAREPLVHFVLLGALIFGADTARTALRGDDRDLLVPASARQEARDGFAATMKRAPTEAEMRQLLARWVDNEILYREGLALGLDRGDPAMRERVIFKALNVVQAGLVLPAVDEAGLRAWFDANRKRYDVPGRVSFDEAVVTSDAAPESLRRFVDALNGQGTPGLDSSLRVFKHRPHDNLVQAYGESFAASLEAARPGLWTVLESTGGLRAVRLTEFQPGRAVPYAEVRDRVYQDWRDDTAARLTTEAVRELGRKYRVREEGGA